MSNMSNISNKPRHVLLTMDEKGIIYFGDSDTEIPSTKSHGYLRLNTQYHHQIIAEALIPNPEKKRCIDHINGNKLDNSIENLRWTTGSENRLNSKMSSNNTSGITGVSFNQKTKKWEVRYKSKFLGYFDHFCQAVRARVLAEKADNGGKYIRKDEELEAEKMYYCAMADRLDITK